MIDPLLKATAVSGRPLRLAGRPAAPARQPAAADSTVPYVPQPGLAGAPAPRGPEGIGAIARVDADAKADARAEAIRRDMESLRSTAHQQAHEAGLAEGRAQGLKEARAEAASQRAEHAREIAAVLNRLAAQAHEQIAGLEPVAVDVVLAACRAILGTAMATPEGVQAAVKAALEAAARDEVLQVRLHPRDMALLSAATGAAGPGSVAASLALRSDDSVGPGGCIVEIAGGSLDARIETQFRLLAAALARGMSATPEGAA